MPVGSSRQEKNDIRDVGSIADLVLVFLIHLVHWYLVDTYPLVPTGTHWCPLVPTGLNDSLFTMYRDRNAPEL